jgi:hypothetical protein
MPHFHIAYWASNAAPWKVFKRVEAESAREAMERAGPQAAGRYRVTVDGSDQTAGLFRISLGTGRCELLEVTAFDRERLDKDLEKGQPRGGSLSSVRIHRRIESKTRGR